MQLKLKKKQKQSEEDTALQKEKDDGTTWTHGAGDKKRGEPGRHGVQAPPQPLGDIAIRDMIAYLMLHRDVAQGIRMRWMIILMLIMRTVLA